MKNQRLSKDEIYKLKDIVSRLHELSSLERACFSSSKEKDEYIKEAIKPYMFWFESIAYELKEILKEDR